MIIFPLAELMAELDIARDIAEQTLNPNKGKSPVKSSGKGLGLDTDLAKATSLAKCKQGS